MKTTSKDQIIAMYKDDQSTMIYAQENNTGIKSRVEEIIGFCQAAGYKKIGIAHCISVSREVASLKHILEDRFDLVSVDCKVGRISKEALVGSGWGAACNPILQARVLNDAATDLNIVMGLCVGHDILFSKHSEAPSTTLLVKDMRYNNDPRKGL